MDVQVQLLRQYAHPQLMASATNCLGSSYYHWNGEEEILAFPPKKKQFFFSFFSLHFYFDQHFGMGFGGDASHTAARPSSLWRLLELQDAHCKHLRGGSERSAVVGSRKCTNIPRITSETLQFNYLFSFQLSFAQQRVANRSADTIQVNVDDVQEVRLHTSGPSQGSPSPPPTRPLLSQEFASECPFPHCPCFFFARLYRFSFFSFLLVLDFARWRQSSCISF